MSFGKKRQHSRLPVRMCALLLGFCLVLNLSTGFASAEGTDNKLKNGSFEEGQTFTKAYDQPDQKDVPSPIPSRFRARFPPGIPRRFRGRSNCSEITPILISQIQMFD